MSDLNEEMQERLLGLWRSYKFYAVVGVLMAVFGASGFAHRYVQYQESRRESGAALFELLRAGEDGDAEAAARALERIDGERFPAMRGLALASLAAAQNSGGDSKTAAATLKEAAAAETEPGMRRMLVLRLAEVLINSGDSGKALEELGAEEPEGRIMRMLFAEKRGDAHLAAGDNRAALSEYTAAREIAAAALPGHMSVLGIKIGAASSLPLAGSQTEQTSGESPEKSADESSESEPPAAE